MKIRCIRKKIVYFFPFAIHVGNFDWLIGKKKQD